MTARRIARDQLDLLHGTLDVLILKTLSWGLSENNRRARYYRLTSAGRAQLRSEVAEWKRYVAAVFKILEPA